MLKIEDIKVALKNADVEVEMSLEDNQTLSFEELGLDSLDVFNLFLELETITGQVVPDEDVDRLLTIADIINYYN